MKLNGEMLQHDFPFVGNLMTFSPKKRKKKKRETTYSFSIFIFSYLCKISNPKKKKKET